MCRNNHFRTLLKAIAAVGVIILAEFQFGDLISRNPMPQEEPLAQDEPLVEKDFHAHLSAKEEATPTQPLVCKCVAKAWPGGKKTDAHLNMSLPWLKHSTLQELRARHPNLPYELLRGAGKKRCSLLPTIFSIEWRNKLWQEAALDATTKFSLYSAFFDPESGVNASVRVLGVSRNPNPGSAWCHLWYSPDGPPRPVRVASTDYLDWQGRKSGRQMPFLLRCPLPPDSATVPLAVSLTGKPCEEATNLLRVVGQRKRAYLDSGNKEKPGEPASLVKGWVPGVCGTALYYYHNDFSVRLVEWLELLRAQGFGQVFLYITDVHPNINTVLRNYEEEGFVQVTDYTYPPPYINEPSLRRLWTEVLRSEMFAQEKIYHTDCVLRHMHQYRFIAHFDPDEMPVLLHHDSFPHFLADISTGKDPHPGYRLRWYVFYNNFEPSKEGEELPEYLWALRHTRREAQHLKRPAPGQFKPVFDMTTVRGVISHGSILYVSGRCPLSEMPQVPTDTAYLAHFRYECEGECVSNTLHDLTLHKYKEEVVSRMGKVLKALHLIR